MPQQQLLLRQLTRRLRPGTLAGFWQACCDQTSVCDPQLALSTVHSKHLNTHTKRTSWLASPACEGGKRTSTCTKPFHLSPQGKYTLQPWNTVANSAYSQQPAPQVGSIFNITDAGIWIA